MTAWDTLTTHRGLASRREFSSERLQKLSDCVCDLLGERKWIDVCVYAAGSFGRLEAGPASDLDIFLVANGGDFSALDEIRLLSGIADINDKLGFPALDKDMRFFKLYTRESLIDHTGQPIDDTENSFTARMLLLLEARPVAGYRSFEDVASAVSENYFRDNKGKKDFKPLFLLNDLLRYWRTLCLNYEKVRVDPEKPWRKKNLNLRFSRLATVFSTVTALLALRPGTAAEFLPVVEMTPFERLATAIDTAGINEAIALYRSFLDDYEWFLQLKDDKGGESTLSDEGVKEESRRRAERVAGFFQATLASEPLSANARYLTL